MDSYFATDECAGGRDELRLPSTKHLYMTGHLFPRSLLSRPQSYVPGYELVSTCFGDQEAKSIYIKE